MDSSQSADVARGPCLRGVALKIRGHDAAGVVQVFTAGVIAGNASVGMVAAMNLERAECFPVVAKDGAALARGLYDVKSAEERLGWRGLRGSRKGEE